MAETAFPAADSGDGRATRKRILRVAQSLFAVSGYEATTVRSIAEGAGLTDPALYYYFRTKQEILEEIVQEPIVKTIVFRASTREELLEELLERVAYWAGSGEMLHLFVRLLLQRHPLVNEHIANSRAMVREAMFPVLEKLYGGRAEAVFDLYWATSYWLFCDETLLKGPHFFQGEAAAAFMARARGIFELVLPQVGAPLMVPDAADLLPPRGEREVPLDARAAAERNTRERILKESLRLFSIKDFDGTTVREIGVACGITDAAIFNHFRSKRAILDTLLETQPERRIPPLEPTKPLTPRMLLRLVESVIDGMEDERYLVALMVRRAMARDEAALAQRRELRHRIRAGFAMWFSTLTTPERAAHAADAVALALSTVAFPLHCSPPNDKEAPAAFARVREEMRPIVLTLLASLGE